MRNELHGRTLVRAWPPGGPVCCCCPHCPWLQCHHAVHKWAVLWLPKKGLLPKFNLIEKETEDKFRVLPSCLHTGPSMVCSSPCWKPRNVPAHWGHLTPWGAGRSMGLYLVCSEEESVIVWECIVLTQQVLIHSYLGNTLLCTKLCLQMSLERISLFAINFSLHAYPKELTVFKIQNVFQLYGVIPTLLTPHSHFRELKILTAVITHLHYILHL